LHQSIKLQDAFDVIAFDVMTGHTAGKKTAGRPVNSEEGTLAGSWNRVSWGEEMVEMRQSMKLAAAPASLNS